MGLVFLRHAYSRYLSVKDAIEANLRRRGGADKRRLLAAKRHLPAAEGQVERQVVGESVREAA